MQAKLALGCRAALCGLGKRPDLNGRQGQLVAWHEAAQRWEVLLEGSGGAIRVRPENLEPLPEGSAQEAPEGCAASSESVKKGDCLYYRGNSCVVLKVSHETDPPHAVVRIDKDGREVGVEIDNLTREEVPQEPQQRLPRVLCLPATTAGPRAIERQLAGFRKSAQGRAELLLAEGWNEPSWDWRELDEADWATFREALDWLQALLRELQPVDAVLGFSQGADFAAMLAGQAAISVGAPLQGVCLLGPHLPRYIGHFPELFAEDEPLRLPALVVPDAKEAKVEAGRKEGVDACNLPSEYAANMFEGAAVSKSTVSVLQNAADARSASASEVDGAVEEAIAFVLGLGSRKPKPRVSVGSPVTNGGKTGLVERWDFACGRWALRLEGGREPVLVRPECLEAVEPKSCAKCGQQGRLRENSPFCGACWLSFRCAVCKEQLGKWEDAEGKLHCSRCLWQSSCAKCRAAASTQDAAGTAFCQACWEAWRCQACGKSAGKQQGSGALLCSGCQREKAEALCSKCKQLKGSEKDDAGKLYCRACWASSRCARCGSAAAADGKRFCGACQPRCTVCQEPHDDVKSKLCGECLRARSCGSCGSPEGVSRDGGIFCERCWALRFCPCGELAEEGREEAGRRYCKDCWASRLCAHCGGFARGHMDEKGEPCCSKCWSARLCQRCKKHVGVSVDDGVLLCARCLASRQCKDCGRPACGKFDEEGKAYCSPCWAQHRLQEGQRLQAAQRALLSELLRRCEESASPAFPRPAATTSQPALQREEKAFLERFQLGLPDGKLPEPASPGGALWRSTAWLRPSSAQGRRVLGGFELSSDFEGGNALPESWSIESRKDAAVLALGMRIANDCHNSSNARSKTFWFSFGVAPTSPEVVRRYPTIRLAVHGMSSQESLFAEGYTPVVWRPSRPAWCRLETNMDYQKEDDKSAGGTYVLSWSHSFQPGDSSGTTYFAFCFPFSFPELQHCLARLEGALLRASEKSGSEPLGCLHGPHGTCCCAWGDALSYEDQLMPSVGTSIYFHRQIVAKTPQERCVEVVTVTEEAASANFLTDDLPANFPTSGLGDWPSAPPRRFPGRPVIFVSARVHPGETPGQFAALGFLRFFCSSDPRAAMLRANYVLKIVPMLNPDGVAWGHSRVNSRGHDLNRCYQDPKPDEHEGIAAVKALLRQWSERGELALYLDCHAHAGVKGCFLYGNLQEEGFIPNIAFAHLAQLNCAHLDIDKCLWSSAPKQEAGRVSVQSDFGLANAYTLECNYHSGRLARPVPDAPGLPRYASWVQEVRGPRMGSSRFAPVAYDPCAWGAVGEALAVSVLDLNCSNPHSRLLVAKPPRLVAASMNELAQGSDVLAYLQKVWEELAARHRAAATVP